MSLNGRVMKESMEMYGATMFAESPLSRQQREMLAVVVSKANHCVYWTQSHAHDLRAEVEGFETEEEGLCEYRPLELGGLQIYVRSRLIVMQTHITETANYSKIEEH